MFFQTFSMQMYANIYVSKFISIPEWDWIIHIVLQSLFIHPQFKPPHSKPHLLLFSKPAISHHFSIISQTYNEGSPFVASCIDQPNTFTGPVLLQGPSSQSINEKPRIDKSLERYNFPQLNQEEIENMNRSITCDEIETVI